MNKLGKVRKIYPVWLGMLIVTGIGITSCGLNRQANSMKALRQCKFELVGVDSLSLAGTDILSLLDGDRSPDLSRLPGVALSFLSGELPLTSLLQLQVYNPTRYTAGIRQFQYEILMDGENIIEGTSDLPFSVDPGATDTVLLHINANVYRLINDRKTRDKILALMDRRGDQDQTGADAPQDPRIQMTLRIKPTIGLGNKSIDYPGYITVDKIIDRATLSHFRF